MKESPWSPVPSSKTQTNSARVRRAKPCEWPWWHIEATDICQPLTVAHVMHHSRETGGPPRVDVLGQNKRRLVIRWAGSCTCLSVLHSGLLSYSSLCFIDGRPTWCNRSQKQVLRLLISFQGRPIKSSINQLGQTLDSVLSNLINVTLSIGLHLHP